MNKISFKELKNIYPIELASKVDEEEIFDYFRIVSLNNDYYLSKSENPLYVCSYATTDDVENGWIAQVFDTRENFEVRMDKNPNATFVIENSMVEQLKNKDRKYIVVDNILDFIDSLFEYFKEKSKAKVIAITGSVGKTTTVGLLEQTLKNKFNVLRIYSKRITPIILKANIINYLTLDIDYVVLEMSIYYKDHVQILSDLLHPDIAGILNIESSHLDVGGFNGLKDICNNKAKIFRYAESAFINKNDLTLKNLQVKDSVLMYDEEELFTVGCEKLSEIQLEDIKIEGDNFLINDSVLVKPFIFSSLSFVQYSLVYQIAKSVGLSDKEIEKAMSNYVPVENRLQQVTAFGKEMIFDGDITTFERFGELSRHFYTKSYLVLRKVGSAENTHRIENIYEYFNRFNKVFIFSDIEYLEELKNHPNVEIVNNHDFLESLDAPIFYHYSGYYRSFSEYDESNLNIYDRTNYVILKREKK